MWVAAFIIISFTYALVTPIMLKIRVNIHQTLVLFTRISLKDIDHYSDLFKKI